MAAAKGIAVVGLIVVIIGFVFTFAIGSAILGSAETVISSMNLTNSSQAAITNLFSVTWSSLPLLVLTILVMIGGAVLAALSWFRV